MITAVDNFVWRSPRPDDTNLALIKAQFKTVVSLEGVAEDEKEAIELSPIVLVSHPISFVDIYFKGIDQKLPGILKSIETGIKPLLVHCQRGQDRTGLVIAAYRVRVSGWSKEAAMEEALQFGYRDWLNLGLNKTWENV